MPRGSTKYENTREFLVDTWLSGVNTPMERSQLFIADDQRIYSYGKHFVIAQRVCQGACVLMNDAYASRTTSKHQTDVRRALYRAEDSGGPAVIRVFWNWASSELPPLGSVLLSFTRERHGDCESDAKHLPARYKAAAEIYGEDLVDGSCGYLHKHLYGGDLNKLRGILGKGFIMAEVDHLITHYGWEHAVQALKDDGTKWSASPGMSQDIAEMLLRRGALDFPPGMLGGLRATAWDRISKCGGLQARFEEAVAMTISKVSETAHNFALQYIENYNNWRKPDANVSRV